MVSFWGVIGLLMLVWIINMVFIAIHDRKARQDLEAQPHHKACMVHTGGLCDCWKGKPPYD